MFDISAAQSAIGTVLTNISFQIFVYLGWVLGIFAALMGLALAIKYLIKYVTGHSAVEFTGGTIAHEKGDWWNHINTEGKDALDGTGLKENLAHEQKFGFLEGETERWKRSRRRGDEGWVEGIGRND
jgi:hypothetical protein